MTPDEFSVKWTAEAAAMRRRGVFVSGADLCAELLADFEAVMRHETSVTLTLAEASRVSQYSCDHLRRLHRDGKLNARRVGRRLFFRAVDLPRKPETLADGGPRGYDPAADARQVATRRNSGAADHG